MSLESRIETVRGTRDWLVEEYARLREVESRLLEHFAAAGYRPVRTPVLEYAALHERKSGAGIVAKLDELSDDRAGRICLRPELTAGIVRAYAAAPECPPLPWRVSASGVVFRHESPRPGFDREFTQVGVERIGDGGPEADAELIWLADSAVRMLGVRGASLRVGHVGLLLEMLERSGLPESIRVALVDVISEAAAEGRDVDAVETAIERLSAWLLGVAGRDGAGVPPPAEAFDRLYRHLVADVTGRRSAEEIVARLRRKWELSLGLREVLARLSARVHELAGLRGPAVTVADRLRADFDDLAPHSVSELVEMLSLLDDRGVDLSRLRLDMGFGRGLGFYTQMIFEIQVSGRTGPIDVGGGGRYDGLARVYGSDRDDRGAGFALGLERLVAYLSS
ncbi:MAG: histidine--tRNA ligase [Isosphaeraceae bacterium]|jgi:histidyl-tRNA synthetase|nr:MAG: histidine--tRNA ligase [Isosphaeraceae bacterium]